VPFGLDQIYNGNVLVCTQVDHNTPVRVMFSDSFSFGDEVEVQATDTGARGWTLRRSIVLSEIALVTPSLGWRILGEGDQPPATAAIRPRNHRQFGEGRRKLGCQPVRGREGERSAWSSTFLNHPPTARRCFPNDL